MVGVGVTSHQCSPPADRASCSLRDFCVCSHVHCASCAVRCASCVLNHVRGVLGVSVAMLNQPGFETNYTDNMANIPCESQKVNGEIVAARLFIAIKVACSYAMLCFVCRCCIKDLIWGSGAKPFSTLGYVVETVIFVRFVFAAFSALPFCALCLDGPLRCNSSCYAVLLLQIFGVTAVFSNVNL